MHEIYLCELGESSAGRINLYNISYIMPHMLQWLEHMNKNLHKFIKRPILTNSHKFVMHIKMCALRYTYMYIYMKFRFGHEHL